MLITSAKWEFETNNENIYKKKISIEPTNQMFFFKWIRIYSIYIYTNIYIYTHTASW